MSLESNNFVSLNLKHCLGLAAPHTWPASVLPTGLGVVLSFVLMGRWDPVLFGCLLLIVILMQSAVNTINDYADFIKSNDTIENSDDPGDAILVYNRLNPKTVRALGFVFLLGAAVPGAWVTIQAGFIPLAIGLIGATVVVLYSLGSLPISYMPLGEFVSGFVMGGLITLAVCTAISGVFDLLVLLYALPLIIGIALLMNTNNICDIEKDTLAGRKTIPVLMGRKRARVLYAVLLAAWILSVCLLVLLFFPKGVLAAIPVFAVTLILYYRQLRLTLTQETRKQAMTGLLCLNMILGLGYIAMIMLHGIISG